MGIGTLVLEAGFNKFFYCPAMWESLEVVVVFSSLGDPSKNENNKQIRTYHCNNFGNDQLRLVVPCNRKVQPSCSSYVPDTMLLILRKAMWTRYQRTWRAVYRLVLSSRCIAVCKLNPLPATPLPLGGCGIIITVSALAAAALRKASFSADDGVRNVWRREMVTAPFSFFNWASKAFTDVPSQVQHDKRWCPDAKWGSTDLALSFREKSTPTLPYHLAWICESL